MTSFPSWDVASELAQQGVPTDVAIPSRQNLEYLGDGIWLDRGAEAKPILLIDGRPHHRFLDHVYLPSATHDLSTKQIFVLNRYRSASFTVDPQFSYNRRIKSIFAQAVSGTNGPVLEVGPSVYPILRPGQDTILCDVDHVANAHNASMGYTVVDPDDLQRLADGKFNLVIGSFVFHFGIGHAEAEQIVRILSPAGVIMFNVLTKAANTRTHAISLLSRLGLRFACYDLAPVLGKQDVMFLGSFGHDTDSFSKTDRTIRRALARATLE